ncbi:MAG: general secretion pathway protein C [Gammaproteobacteria bacterium]
MLQDYLIKLLANTQTRYLTLLIFLSLLAYQSSILFWSLYPISSGADLVSQNQLITARQPIAQPTSYLQQADLINQGFLFGKAAVVSVKPVQSTLAPETQLNYKLRGIYFSNIAEQSNAIVETKVNDSQLYRIDDALADNIIVAAIEKDHILINRYGKFERLNLEKPDDIGTQQGTNSSSINSLSSVANTNLLRNYRQTFASNPLALAQRFQSIPVQQNGKNIGFKLKALRGERLLDELNFQDSDIFTKINGIGLDKPFQALEALKSLTTANSVAVTILRNGREQTLDFSL